MKILITNYTGYRSNWGSQATSRGLVQFLKAIDPQSTNLEIDILPYPPTHLLDHFHELAKGKKIEKILSKEAPSKREIHFISKLCKSRFGCAINRLKNADLVIFQGEGALGTGREYSRCQIFGPSFLAKHLLKKPSISMNQTITYRSENNGETLAKIFKVFDQNYVRETASLTYTSGPNWPKFNLIPDAAFFYKSAHTSSNNMNIIKKPYFCVTGSANLKSYDLKAYCDAIYWVSKQKNLIPVFMYSRSSDKKIVDFYKKTNKDFITVSSKTHPDVDSILPILEHARFVLGGRYHTSISALTRGTPVILTPSNSKKSKGLQNLLGANNVALISDPNIDTIQREVDIILSEGNNRRSRITQAVKALNQLSIDNSTTLVELMRDIECNSTSRFNLIEPDPSLPTLGIIERLLRPLSIKANIKHFDRTKFQQNSLTQN